MMGLLEFTKKTESQKKESKKERHACMMGLLEFTKKTEKEKKKSRRETDRKKWRKDRQTCMMGLLLSIGEIQTRPDLKRLPKYM